MTYAPDVESSGTCLLAPPPAVSASCSSSLPTRQRRGSTSTSCGVGCRSSRRGATSASPHRQSATLTKALAAFRLLPEPLILVTVAMAYEGLDAPEVAVVATFRRRIETEQGTLARKSKVARQGSLLPDWLLDQLAERGPREDAIVPLKSNALGLRYAILKPGPSFADARPENEEPQTELLDPPSVVERRLRLRIGEMVAAQAVKDEAGASAQRGQGRYHGYNAVLKRATGCNRSSAQGRIPARMPHARAEQYLRAELLDVP